MRCRPLGNPKSVDPHIPGDAPDLFSSATLGTAQPPLNARLKPRTCELSVCPCLPRPWIDSRGRTQSCLVASRRCLLDVHAEIRSIFQRVCTPDKETSGPGETSQDTDISSVRYPETSSRSHLSAHMTRGSAFAGLQGGFSPDGGSPSLVSHAEPTWRNPSEAFPPECV